MPAETSNLQPRTSKSERGWRHAKPSNLEVRFSVLNVRYSIFVTPFRLRRCRPQTLSTEHHDPLQQNRSLAARLAPMACLAPRADVGIEHRGFSGAHQSGRTLAAAGVRRRADRQDPHLAAGHLF